MKSFAHLMRTLTTEAQLCIISLYLHLSIFYFVYLIPTVCFLCLCQIIISIIMCCGFPLYHKNLLFYILSNSTFITFYKIIFYLHYIHYLFTFTHSIHKHTHHHILIIYKSYKIYPASNLLYPHLLTIYKSYKVYRTSYFYFYLHLND